MSREPGRGGAPPTDLHRARLAAVLAAVRGAGRVLDLGCGDGAFAIPMAEAGAEVTALDLDRPALERLAARLREAAPEVRARVRVLHGDLTRAGGRLTGFDAAVLVETIEHVPPGRLGEVERAVFAGMRPGRVAVTTPNADFNPLLGTPPGRMRHPDHRFEWGRARFRRWAEGVAARHGYAACFEDIGGAHPTLGGPSQMAVFDRQSGQ